LAAAIGWLVMIVAWVAASVSDTLIADNRTAGRPSSLNLDVDGT
jgi:hypothetical protein